jgi:hypothetical protein
VRRIARRYAPVAEYREFAGQGHWVLGQPGWQHVADSVADWLDHVLPPRLQVAAVDREKRQG